MGSTQQPDTPSVSHGTQRSPSSAAMSFATQLVQYGSVLAQNNATAELPSTIKCEKRGKKWPVKSGMLSVHAGVPP